MADSHGLQFLRAHVDSGHCSGVQTWAKTAKGDKGRRGVSWDGAMAGHLYFAIVRVPARPLKRAQKVTAAREAMRSGETRLRK